jgi:GNAT superfamily N-acetyltransferase
MSRRLATGADLAAACGDDPLCMWAGQRLGSGGCAWELDGAVAVAGPDLSGRDRLALWGDPVSAARLAREVLAELGPSYRPLGPAGLICAVTAELGGLEATPEFAWMDTVTPPPEATGSTGWLGPAEWPAASELIGLAFPDSYAKPGLPGVRRWAGLRDDTGRLIAVAADAWSAPTVGLLTGVAVHPQARGLGAGAAVCSFVLSALVADYGRAGLMVGCANTAAIRIYERLGMTGRPMRAAGVPGPRRPPA